MCVPTIEQVMNETQIGFLGIDLKYLVKALEFHLAAAKEENDYANTLRFELDLGNAQVLLEKFCKIFPKQAPKP